MKKILIVEDDMDIHNLIKQLLDKKYMVSDAYSGTEALLLLEKYSYDLILLDLMLPGICGEEIIRRYSSTPIIVISAKTKIDDKVQTLLEGARDYMIKPFHNEELLARVAVQLREPNIKAKNLEYKDLVLDCMQYTLTVKNDSISLTKTEFSILKQLMLNSSQILSKSKLLDLICLETPDGDENTLKVHISNIRKKIRKITEQEYIEAIWGIGYRLK